MNNDCTAENIALKNKLDLVERNFAILSDVDFLKKLYKVGVAQETEIQTITKSRDDLAKKVEDLENKVDRLEWENKGIDEWRDEYLAVRQRYDKLMLAASLALQTLYGYEASIKKFGLLFGNGQLAVSVLKDAGVTVNE